jgi:hypothetical protein
MTLYSLRDNFHHFTDIHFLCLQDGLYPESKIPHSLEKFIMRLQGAIILNTKILLWLMQKNHICQPLDSLNNATRTATVSITCKHSVIKFFFHGY